MAASLIKNLYEKPTRAKELVSDVMNPDPHIILANNTLYQASQEMLKYECGFLVVVDENKKPVGALTDRDIVIFGIAAGKDPKTCKISEIMSDNLLTCYKNETLQLAADHMGENGVRRLAVLNENDDLAGVISIVDMLKHVENDSMNIEVIEHLYKYA